MLASLPDISKIKEDGQQLSRAILNGEYDKCKEILKRNNVSVNKIYCSYSENKKNAFEECYRNMQRLEIAKLVSNHHSFDPNEKCIKFFIKSPFQNDVFKFEIINILEFLYKLYDQDVTYFVIDRMTGIIMDDYEEFEEKEFEKMKPFIHLLVFHPKMLESTIMNVIAICKTKIFKNYLEQSLINKKAASYWLFCCQTRIFPFYPDLSKKIADLIIE